MKQQTAKVLDDLMRRRPELRVCRSSIQRAFELILDAQEGGGTLLVCGNGGSAADALHIVGELVKSFSLPRPLPKTLRAKLEEFDIKLAETLQSPIRAVSLCSEAALMTAVANDLGGDYVFAQQVLGQGRQGDALLCITSSGNSMNVVNAAVTAKALGLQVIALTGRDGGKMTVLADCTILAPGDSTAEIQESHLPIHHAICQMLESETFGD